MSECLYWVSHSLVHLRDERQGPWWSLRKFYEVGEYMDSLKV